MNSNSARIGIVGAGFAGTDALRRLHKLFRLRPDVTMTIVNERNYFLFAPFLHEVATGSIKPSNIVEPIRKVLGACFRNFYIGKAQRSRSGAATSVAPPPSANGQRSARSAASPSGGMSPSGCGGRHISLRAHLLAEEVPGGGRLDHQPLFSAGHFRAMIRSQRSLTHE